MDRAHEIVKRFQITPKNELLILHGLYMQAKNGDNNSKPLVCYIDKWNAWLKNKGKSQQQAKKEYISMVYELMDKYL